MLDQDRTRRGVIVPDGVRLDFAYLAHLIHHALEDSNALNPLRIATRRRTHADAEVSRIREQALFARLDRVGDSFASEGLVFEDAEAPAIKRELAGVRQPKRTQRPRGIERR